MRKTTGPAQEVGYERKGARSVRNKETEGEKSIRENNVLKIPKLKNMTFYTQQAQQVSNTMNFLKEEEDPPKAHFHEI